MTHYLYKQGFNIFNFWNILNPVRDYRTITLVLAGPAG